MRSARNKVDLIQYPEEELTTRRITSLLTVREERNKGFAKGCRIKAVKKGKFITRDGCHYDGIT